MENCCVICFFLPTDFP
ncbi:unnamed protein product [Spirodela intermedia]|uniref:Uncharacterized protein n=1 Tax=Spirodela intermedia TaxID=51605 RepID=A0A7I8KGM3_SPIIN|nr:unnamed protein product [Spirodela intermedia]